MEKNKIKCIVGKARSGKTTELIRLFITEQTSGTSYNSIFITCEETAEAIKQACAKADDIRTFGKLKNVNYTVLEARSKDDIVKIINSFILENNCRFYIDMPEIHLDNFGKLAERFVDIYPSIKTNNEMDIIWTRSKSNSIYYKQPKLTRYEIYRKIYFLNMEVEKNRAEYLGVDFNEDHFSRESNILAVKKTEYYYHRQDKLLLDFKFNSVALLSGTEKKR